MHRHLPYIDNLHYYKYLFYVGYYNWNFNQNKQGTILSLVKSNQLFMPKAWLFFWLKWLNVPVEMVVWNDQNDWNY